jgi:serine/threonine-protein kinase HipA
MTNELVTLLGGQEIGRVRRDARDRITFTYSDEWRCAEDAYPLSLRMPLAAREHGPAAIEAFLWGLLPDNEFVLERWAKKFQISPRNVFALITNVGEDCAGAVQFVQPDRVAAMAHAHGDHDNEEEHHHDVEWLDEAGMEARLKALREDHAAWRLPRDTGQFSLAGAQPKTALLFEDGRWGVPSGRTPTTHILKPPTGQFDGHAENEHICLALARSMGLPTASSRVMRFGGEVAIVVERYDRIRTGNSILRVHQEDICQAMGIMPTRKYQNEGGPGVADIVDLLRTYSSAADDDVATFIDAVAFNWLIAGADAHAKNYSLLLSGGPRVRLAPLYDVASLLPYEQYDPWKTKLSMKVGGEYRLRDIRRAEWVKLARDVRVEADALIARIATMAAQLPDQISAVHATARAEGLDLPIIDALTAKLIERAIACGTVLSGVD